MQKNHRSTQCSALTLRNFVQNHIYMNYFTSSSRFYLFMFLHGEFEASAWL